jgi:nicotinamidase/pyrazinamidase
MRSDFVFWAVDVQADFMLPGGKLYVPGAEEIIPAIKRLIDVCRTAGALLISSADAHNADDAELRQWPPHCMKGTAGAEIIPEARLPKVLTIPNNPAFRLPADTHNYEQVVIQKNELNVFTNPNTDELLKALPSYGISNDAEFIVFGVVTEYCVQFAAEGLLKRGKRVAVVTDAIKEIEAAKGECSLRDFQSQGARLVTVAELERSLLGESLRRA